MVNLDPHHSHSGWLSLSLNALGLSAEVGFQVHDLMSDARYLWKGSRVFVTLDPAIMPAHVFRVRRHVRSERTFEYYLERDTWTTLLQPRGSIAAVQVASE